MENQKLQLKTVFFLTCIILFFILPLFCYAEDSVSKQEAINIDTSKGFNLVAIGGLGMTTGSNDWSYAFYLGPAFNFGLEIPFTSAHVFALEIMGQMWMSKTKNLHLTTYYNDNYRVYNNIYKDFYSANGISTVLKYYIGSKNSQYRLSVHAGWLATNPDPGHSGLDFGLSLYYYINRKLSLSLSQRIQFGKIDPNGNSNNNPNLLLLGFNYKFSVFNDK